MKKYGVLHTLSILCFIVFGMLALATGSPPINYGEFRLRWIGEGRATIEFYFGSDTEIQIPSRVGDVEVVGISRRAFADRGLTSVIFHYGIVFIGERAFAGNQLSSVTIPSSVYSIRREAFYGNRLTHVVIPDSVRTIGLDAFTGNPLVSIITGEGTHVMSTPPQPDTFVWFYERQRRAAGKYTFSDGQWSFQPR